MKQFDVPSTFSSPPWSLSAEEAIHALGVDPIAGLGADEVEKRLRRYGPNRVDVAARTPAWRVAVNQFKNFIVLLLAVAASVSFALNQTLEGIAILVALGLNVCIGFGTELKALRSMEALEMLGVMQARVRRGGAVRSISADDLVPGDMVELEAGDVVPADLRLVEASRLMVDESALTGESVPVGKVVDPAQTGALLAERHSMLFKSTIVTMGSAHAVVVGTGGATEIGRISRLAEEAVSEETPLQRRLDRLGRRLVWFTLAVAVCVGAAGFATGMAPFLLFETAVALAVAAIPEGLPIVATIALARGMWRMADRNALINHLTAVETLGSVNELMTDKTGTLTANRLRVAVFLLPGHGGGPVRFEASSSEPGTGGPVFVTDGSGPEGDLGETLAEALRVGVLCNNASLSEKGPVGDPLEAALLEAGRVAGLHRESLLEAMPEEREEAFDPDLALMATVHAFEDGGHMAMVKGAPEAVLERCATLAGNGKMGAREREAWLDANDRLAGEGFRVLALARRRLDDPDDGIYEDMEFLGLTGFLDPPRPGVAEVVADLGRAGIRMVMVTGDQAQTASAIAARVGLIADGNERVVTGAELPDLSNLASLDAAQAETIAAARVFARVSPEQKIQLAELLQARGRVVAMTGDGVNDAPALKRADIGVAMGGRGTQAARQAADMVLTDDELSSVLAAVNQGRIIFENIRRFLMYLLSGNVGEILLVGAAMLAGLPLPLLPLQILYLNMISDVFPALALGVGGRESGLMDEPARDPHEPMLTRSHWWTVMVYGGLIAASSLAAFLWARGPLGLGPDQAVTVSFLGLAFGRTWHVFNMRRYDSGILYNEVTRNRWIWAAVALSIGLLLLALFVSPLALVLRLRWPGIEGGLVILGTSLIPLVVVQSAKCVRAWRTRSATED